MGEICIGDVRSLFKSNYVGRLTRSQVVAFQIADTGGPPRARDVVRVPANLHTELNSSIRRPFLARKIRRRGGERRRGGGEKGHGVVSFKRTDCGPKTGWKIIR